MSQQKIIQIPIKKIKINEQSEQADKQWIVVRKKTTPLTISISDHSKVNRYYSHKSIQKYIRYLLTQTCPNPMWLAIKRQSQIQHIYYIDIQIQDYLFQKLIQQKTLAFLGQKITLDNKAVFKEQRLNRYVWDSLLVYDQQSKIQQQQQLRQFVNTQKQRTISKQVYQKYLSNTLTPQQMKQNLYPDLKLPLYRNYHTIQSNHPINQQQNQTINNKVNQVLQLNIQKLNQINYTDNNLILVVDCQMVTTQKGFQLARCTIVNYGQQVIFDEFFKPENQILNYNTEFSGITKQILDPIANTINNTLYPFLDKFITKDTVLIGHSLQNDFNAMQFYHKKVVDTSVLFKRKNGSKMKLKNLADKILKRKIQSLTHDSKQDCLATLHLVQIKIQSELNLQMQKQYHLLRDITKLKHNVLFIDYDITNMRKYNSIHFEKVDICQNPLKIAQIIKKYSNKAEVCVPKVSFSRFLKPQIKEWQQYYTQVNSALQHINSSVPQGSVLFLNFQINQLVRVVPFTKQDQDKPRTRPFAVIFPKN